MLISQISTLTGDGAAVLRDFLVKTQFGRLAQFREDGTDYMKYELSERSDASFRPKNGDYGTPEDDNPSPELGELKFLGKEAQLDKSYKIDAEKGDLNLTRYKMRLLKRRAYALARSFDKLSWTGDGTGSNITGLATILNGTNVGGFGDTFVLDGNDIDLTNTTNYDAFMRMLDEALEEVPGANVIAVNGKLKSIINTVGRKSGNIDRMKDAFGRPYNTYNDIPVVRLNDGAILNSERNKADTADETTSLYIMRMEEIDGICLSSNSGLQYTGFPELEAKVTEKARMEIYYNWTIEAPDAVRRLEHLKVV